MQEVRDFPRALPNHLETSSMISYFCSEKPSFCLHLLTIYNTFLFTFGSKVYTQELMAKLTNVVLLEYVSSSKELHAF